MKQIHVYWIDEHAVEHDCIFNCDECVFDKYGVSLYWGTWYCCLFIYVRWDEFPEFTFSIL